MQTLAAILFLIAVWVAAYLAAGNELLVPSFSDCGKEVGRLLCSGAFWRGLLHSLLRTLAAFSVSFFLAVIFAVLSSTVPSFATFFAPVVSALRSLPVLAVLLILLTLFGANSAPVVVAFLSLFPMLYAGLTAALHGIDKKLIDMAKVCGIPVWKRVFHIYIPLASPYALREMGAALSLSLKLIVSAEVLANTAKSLGGMMQEAAILSNAAQLFALVGVAFLVGLLLEGVISVLAIGIEKRMK